jgi:hypothetical protein
VAGDCALSDHEQLWSLTPQKSWTAGQYQHQVPNTLEDLARNKIGKAFEVALFENGQRRFTNSVVEVPFQVK